MGKCGCLSVINFAVIAICAAFIDERKLTMSKYLHNSVDTFLITASFPYSQVARTIDNGYSSFTIHASVALDVCKRVATWTPRLVNCCLEQLSVCWSIGCSSILLLYFKYTLIVTTHRLLNYFSCNKWVVTAQFN